MQVGVSMYFATVGVFRSRVFVPHIDAEARLISSACSLIVASSSLIELNEERLVLRRPSVRVTHGWSEEIRERSFVTFRGRITPVNREADVPQRLAVDLHRGQ